LAQLSAALGRRRIERLCLPSTHGGRSYRPLICDTQARHKMLIVLINFWQLAPKTIEQLFHDPGDHAGELETSFLLHVQPDWVLMNQAGEGATVPFKLKTLKQPGVWPARPWSQTH